MSGQVRFILRQKCLIQGRRLLCSEDTSKASPKTTFSTLKLSANAIFASGAAIGIGILATGTVAFNSLNLFNYSVYKSIIEDASPLIMKMIEGDLISKLCETSISITEFDNVGDDSNYVARPSLEKCILQASEQSLKNKGGLYTIVVGAKGAGKTSAVARVLREKKGVLALLVDRKSVV